MHSTHHTDISCVHMESCSINILRCTGIIVDGCRVIRSIKVVIICYYFSFYVPTCKSWAQIIFYEISFMLGREIHAWIIAWMERLVLWSDSINVDSLCLHGFNILYKIFSIRVIVLWLKTASHTFFVIFHPSWWTPWS